MSEWAIELELVDGSSKKFWRAKTDGADLIVNYGRIGTNGQTKTKSLDDAGAAAAQLAKVAASKRKKGYADCESAPAAAPAPAPAPVEEASDEPVTLKFERDGRTIEVGLRVEDGVLHTALVERYKGKNEAATAMQRVRDALVDEGYR